MAQCSSASGKTLLKLNLEVCQSRLCACLAREYALKSGKSFLKPDNISQFTNQCYTYLYTPMYNTCKREGRQLSLLFIYINNTSTYIFVFECIKLLQIGTYVYFVLGVLYLYHSLTTLRNKTTWYS